MLVLRVFLRLEGACCRDGASLMLGVLGRGVGSVMARS